MGVLLETIRSCRRLYGYVEVTKSKGTYNFYNSYAKMLIESIGDLACEDINNKVILKFIKQQRNRNDKISNATLNKAIAMIKTVIKYSCNIKIEFKKLKEQKKVIPTVSKETIDKVFNYYQKHLDNRYAYRNYLYLRLLLDTGLRLSELNNINTNNIDFTTKSIYVDVTKTDVDRIVCFTSTTSKLLFTFIARYKIKGRLFFDFKSNKPFTTTSVESFIYRLKSKLKIKENITPHKWRHTFATNFVRDGGDLETLRLLLGHSNLRTTQKYLHLSKNDIINNYQSIMR